MASPIDPEICVNTGRLLTEWFEFPEYTDEQIERMAAEKHGVTVEEIPREWAGKLKDTDPERYSLQKKIYGSIASLKKRKWPHTMSQQEVHHRLNEATKMVDPSNFKFLPDDVRERTGLEINPLWMMECLVRSGILNPKEQVAALKELANYTHSKAPSISHSTSTQMKPEDWLFELAKDEYKVIGVDIPMKQPMTPIEAGMHKWHEKRKERITSEIKGLVDYGAQEFEALEAEISAADLEGFNLDDD